MACTWTITTNQRSLTLRGEGTPVMEGISPRCEALFGANSGYQLIRLSEEADGYCAYPTESIVNVSPSDCEQISPDQKYDCVNGGCVPKTTYNTPGVFASLAACQSGCATNSNCLGECVEATELAALQQAANALQSKFCS